MHVLPQLEELEMRFPESLVVIGVHSPKFYAEQEFQNVRQAVLRYDIRHPVVSDPDHIVWDSYAVSAWPTAVIIDPEGRVVGQHSGEFVSEDYVPVISGLEEEFDRQGKLNRAPVSLSLERDKEPARPLNFPGKILADVPAGRIFIADTGHNRILKTDLNGHVQAVVGSGEPGIADGDFANATFRFPYGMAVDGLSRAQPRGEILYVADTWNHSIRRVDFESRRVDRIAGTGEQAILHRRGGPALSTALSSPWDLALCDNMLYIAMAGTHQIWALDIPGREVRVFAGTGREALADGSLQRSALAQPSGLALSNGRLYFADSESSAVRVADTTAYRVETIIGEGLFEFGDRDGRGSEARLQHCLGVAYHDGFVYVADTYNNKVKLVDPADRSSRTFLGTGEAGLKDGSGVEAMLWEPGGLSISDNQLYIADTNNHAIRIADLTTREVRTLEIG